MRRVHRQGCEHRENLGEKILFEPAAFLDGHLGRLEHRDPDLAQCRLQIAPDLLLPGHEPAGTALDRRQLLRRRQAVLAQSGDARRHLRLQAGDAHHVELVEIGGGDGQEADALKHRMTRVRRLVQDALVERQPRQLAIGEARRAADIGRVPPGSLAWSRSPLCPLPSGSSDRRRG